MESGIVDQMKLEKWSITDLPRAVQVKSDTCFWQNRALINSFFVLYKGVNMFTDKENQQEMENMFQNWQTDSLDMKPALLRLKDLLSAQENTVLSFHSRPGVTYSLRAAVKEAAGNKKPLFVMVDIIDDDPQNRWLSVCFYGDMISDPNERGDFVPGGLLGEDALCFDYDSPDEGLLSYIEQRINEAHNYMTSWAILESSSGHAVGCIQSLAVSLPAALRFILTFYGNSKNNLEKLDGHV